MTSATTTDSVTSDLAKLPDTGLAYLVRQLEAKIAALKFSTTAIGARLLESIRKGLTPDGSADPGALSARARLSGSPSERAVRLGWLSPERQEETHTACA
jgi:hypothetical protein